MAQVLANDVKRVVLRLINQAIQNKSILKTKVQQIKTKIANSLNCGFCPLSSFNKQLAPVHVIKKLTVFNVRYLLTYLYRRKNAWTQKPWLATMTFLSVIIIFLFGKFTKGNNSIFMF